MTNERGGRCEGFHPTASSDACAYKYCSSLCAWRLGPAAAGASRAGRAAKRRAAVEQLRKNGLRTGRQLGAYEQKAVDGCFWSQGGSPELGIGGGTVRFFEIAARSRAGEPTGQDGPQHPGAVRRSACRLYAGHSRKGSESASCDRVRCSFIRTAAVRDCLPVQQAYAEAEASGHVRVCRRSVQTDAA